MAIDWYCLPFEKLAPADLYDALKLRAEVFQIEQNCLYLDIDGRDAAALHVFGRDAAGTLAAYARLFAPNIKGSEGQIAEAVIGRVITAPQQRGSGLGHELMKKSVALVKENFGDVGIYISAQAHLQGFYAQHGFVAEGAEYLEDDIPHIKMRRL